MGRGRGTETLTVSFSYVTREYWHGRGRSLILGMREGSWDLPPNPSVQSKS